MANSMLFMFYDNKKHIFHVKNKIKTVWLYVFTSGCIQLYRHRAVGKLDLNNIVVLLFNVK